MHMLQGMHPYYTNYVCEIVNPSYCDIVHKFHERMGFLLNPMLYKYSFTSQDLLYVDPYPH